MVMPGSVTFLSRGGGVLLDAKAFPALAERLGRDCRRG
jgi:hypothetical protein